MSEQGGSLGLLTRRGFAKAACASAGVLGATSAASMFSVDGWLKPSQASADAEETVSYTFHQCHCQCNCHLKCTARDGRVVKIEPNKWEDPYNETVCLKGISEIQHIYAETRLQSPLKRVGERGSGEFVAISWDEALDTIAQNIKNVQAKYGRNAVCVQVSRDAMYCMIDRLTGGQLDTKRGIDVGLGNGFAPALAEKSGQGLSSNEVRDWKRARTILNVGNNMLESCMMASRYFFDAKEAGAEIITVDPHFSTTASKSSSWVPIEPGTDAALYLGMITLILEKGWYDASYLLANTSMPFLVSCVDGSMLRARPASSPKEKGADNPFMVWDAATASVKPYSEADVAAELEATAVVDGVEYETVFSALKRNQKPYTLAWASGKTGIPEEKIAEITEKYACNGPQILAFGWGGIDKFANSDIVGHAAVVLATLVGSFGVDTGAGAGAYVNSYEKGFGMVGFPAWPLPEECKKGSTPKGTMDMRDESSNIHMLFIQGDTLQQRAANMNKTREWANGLDFIVVCDAWHVTSADYADMVLPVCTKFELEEQIGWLRAKRNHVLLQQKVIDPVFESHSDFWIECELAKRLGYGDYIPSSIEEVVRYQLENVKSDAVKGITLEELVEHNGVVMQHVDNAPKIHYAGQTYATASGKIDLYYEDRLGFGQALPTYEDPCEAYAENPLRTAYPLQLNQKRSKFHVHNKYCDAGWIKQYDEVCVTLNPADGMARGILDGDAVEVFNERGSFGCTCRLDESVRPGTVSVIEGLWSRYMDHGNVQDVTNDTVIERGTILPKGRVIPFNDTLVEIKKA